MHIVYYHNVLEEPIDDLDLRCSRLSVQSFRKQMEFLKKNFRPVSLSELLARADGGDDDPDCVSVTFDDAYEGVGKPPDLPGTEWEVRWDGARNPSCDL